ncbi:hypothetical protein FA95DRAFT_1558326 [Auriscalpium vulgare]|uniref:Uncharacterized protein n=1 Tax=Auriscalpium vulgare TaxID=40419 RepID=A0ACB8RVQ0_9AGAM|nr:hypothetical protein FA95DRAFT_1558326 [Auriscalpium vulgare]
MSVGAVATSPGVAQCCGIEAKIITDRSPLRRITTDRRRVLRPRYRSKAAQSARAQGTDMAEENTKPAATLRARLGAASAWNLVTLTLTSGKAHHKPDRPVRNSFLPKPSLSRTMRRTRRESAVGGRRCLIVGLPSSCIAFAHRTLPVQLLTRAAKKLCRGIGRPSG